MQSKLNLLLMACLVSATGIPVAFAAQGNGEVVDHAEAQARDAWRENMRHVATPGEGCYHAAYPSIIWERVSCGDTSFYRSAKPIGLKHKSFATTGGNGNDYVVQVPGQITETIGSFPSVTGVKSEKGVVNPDYPPGAITGKNMFTLQINSSFSETTAACGGVSGCTIWQQAVYAPDYIPSTFNEQSGVAYIFIENWLMNYGDSCPNGWSSDGQGDCVYNSPGTKVPVEPITDLGEMKFSESVAKGGNDTVVFTVGNDVYSTSSSDSYDDLADAWNESEFNVVGDMNGAIADFNSGSSVTVNIAVADGSTAAPSCIGPSGVGTTGESNNLTLGSTCTASADSTTKGTNPSIQFKESN
jgi:hypothetical protein